ncbi:MAG: hypothetical protein CMK83_25565 [Pseudomonadales bacterium]|nr:hypothetical protein [Pseudomonadales bacterium]MBI25614.1 hypothetical protein [Pseudomonadales bacterium]
MEKFLWVCVFALFSINAYSIGEVSNAQVTKVRVDLDGRAMVFFDRPMGGTPPGCVNPAYVDALAFDASTSGGKAILGMVLTAKSTGSPISAFGMGFCSIYGGSTIETWNNGFLK